MSEHPEQVKSTTLYAEDLSMYGMKPEITATSDIKSMFSYMRKGKIKKLRRFVEIEPVFVVKIDNDQFEVTENESGAKLLKVINNVP